MRNYAQYVDKPKLQEWLGILPTQIDKIYSVASDVRDSYNIDTATTYELDVLGRIVGIDRTYESEVFFEPLARFGDGTVFGDDITFSAEGMTITQEVSDEIYRTLLKAKIVKNNSDATIRGVIQAVQFITDAIDVSVVNNENMTFSIQINDTITDIQIFVLDTFDIVPRGQGVRFLGYDYTPTNSRFGDGTLFGDGSQFSEFFGA